VQDILEVLNFNWLDAGRGCWAVSYMHLQFLNSLSYVFLWRPFLKIFFPIKGFGPNKHYSVHDKYAALFSPIRSRFIERRKYRQNLVIEGMGWGEGNKCPKD